LTVIWPPDKGSASDADLAMVRNDYFLSSLLQHRPMNRSLIRVISRQAMFSMNAGDADESLVAAETFRRRARSSTVTFAGPEKFLDDLLRALCCNRKVADDSFPS
jgi:hypothetical protein